MPAETRLFLIVRIEDASGHVVESFSKGQQRPGDVRLADVQAVVHGRYEVRIGAARSDLVAVAYKSPNADGAGRAGGQFQRFGARSLG